MGIALSVSMTCCVIFVQPNSTENTDRKSSSTGKRVGCMSAGMSSVNVVACSHNVEIAWGHSSSIMMV